MSAKSKSDPSEKKPAAPAQADKPAPRRGPLLLETAITASQLALVVTGAGVFGLSLQAGADLTASALRSGAAVLVLGLLLWLVNWWLARGSLEAVARQMREAAEAQANARGTLDVNA